MKKLFSISFFFRWFDLWMGIFIDTKNRAVYICPVPTLGVKITYPNKYELLYRFKWKKLCGYVSPEIYDGYGYRLCHYPSYLATCNLPVSYVSYSHCLNSCKWRYREMEIR